jgi:hypothetical protein
LKNAVNKLVFLVSICYLAVAGFFVTAAHGQSSVLQSGKWYKVAIEKNGVYKIDQSLFKKMGFPSNADPRKIKIYGNEGGMLPQANSASRPIDLIENAIFIQGENDGMFNSGDYILFYAQGADKITFNKEKEIFSYEHNLYADKNYYFITIGESNGKRIMTTANPGNGTPVNTFENFAYHELDKIILEEIESGREWYGEQFNSIPELENNFSLPNIVPGSDIKIVSDVMAKSFTGSSFKIFLNGIQVGQQIVPSILNSQYGVKGSDKRDTLIFNESSTAASTHSTQNVKYQYVKNPSGIGYLDYFLLQVRQTLNLYGQQTIFRSLQSLGNAISKYDIGQSVSQTIVWDITNPYEPALQQTTFAGGKTSFSSTSTELKDFIAFSAASAPQLAGAIANQNIRALSVPNYVIVTNTLLESEALRLAEHRAADGISVKVVTTNQIFNEFSSGRQDVSAIRDFAKSLYDRQPTTIKAILLFGKGSYDYKDRVSSNVNLVPIYESRNSLDPLKTYSSDDFYTFLQNNEGEWGEEAPFISHTMDIAIGRIPVKNITEAKNVVDKLIRYDTDKNLFGKWRKELVFVADDGDFNLHQDDANDLAQYIESTHQEFNTKKIFLDAYPQESRASGEVSEETNRLIEDVFNTGALVINYTGHGGERLWAQEKIFDDVMISRLENKRLPLLVTATCEFGRQDHPIFTSGAELCILKKDGGAIGLVTTSRPVNAATNFILNEAFYNAFFQKENNQYLTLGEIFRRTKNSSISGVSNRNFSLIGDPMLHLAAPREKIVVTEVKTQSGSSTLKALSTVTIKGIVADDLGDTISSFNGVVESTLFDKMTHFITLGNENQPYPFAQWYNALFRGKASIENGVFEFQFVVPKNIAYQIDEGKLSLYAYDTITNIEASGYSQSFDIGSSEPNPDPDLTSPLLSVFIGDESFVNGGVTNSNTTLVAKLDDANGINISGYGIGNSIMGTLDGSENFILNDFYVADVNNFKKGTILFPLTDLSPGKHTIVVKAWDTHNNPVQAQVNFVVTDGNNITIETFGAYPNPFETSTSLFFTHNRSGDDLQVSVTVYDYTGSYIESYDLEVPSSPYHVDLLKLNRQGLKNRSGGLYFARLIVRSLTNGSKNEQVTKLIMSN